MPRQVSRCFQTTRLVRRGNGLSLATVRRSVVVIGGARETTLIVAITCTCSSQIRFKAASDWLGCSMRGFGVDWHKMTTNRAYLRRVAGGEV